MRDSVKIYILRCFLTAAVFLCASLNVFASGGLTGLPFLNYDVGARYSALGGAGLALADDAFGAYKHPAALGKIKDYRLAFMHLEYFGDVKYNYAAFVFPLRKVGTFSLASSYSYVEDVVQTASGPGIGFTNYDAAFILSYGLNAVPKLNIGASAKYINSKLYSYKASGYAFDFSANYNILGNFYLAASYLNHGSGITYLTDNTPLPRTYIAGLAYKFENIPLNLAFDYVKEKEVKPSYKAGAEYGLTSNFTIRGGWSYNREIYPKNIFSGGLGFNIKDWSADYSYSSHGDLGNTHRISTDLRFGGDDPDKHPLAALDLNFYGSLNLNYSHVDIDNTGVSNLIKGSNSDVNLVALGSVGDKNVNFRINVINNEWDRTKTKDFVLEVSDKNSLYSFGKNYLRFSRYLVYNQQITGFYGKHTFKFDETDYDRYYYEQFMEAAKGIEPRAGALAPSALLKGDYKKPFKLRDIELQFAAGRSKEPQNVGDKIRYQNSYKVSVGRYEQELYAGLLKFNYVDNTEVSLGYSYIKDDELSLFAPGTTLPLKNSNAAFNFTKMLSDKVRITAEAARSSYDNDIEDTKSAQTGTAFDVKTDMRLAKGYLSVSYKRINPDFYAVGNPSMSSERDKEGVFSYYDLNFKNQSSLKLKADYYWDNLKNDENYTTKSLNTGLTYNLKFLTNYNLTLSYDLNLYKSDDSIDTTAYLLKYKQRSNIYNLYLTRQFKKISVYSNVSFTDAKDKSDYSTEPSQRDYKILSFASGVSANIKNITGSLNFSKIWRTYYDNPLNAATSDNVKNQFYNLNFNMQAYIIPEKLRANLNYIYMKSAAAAQSYINIIKAANLTYYYSNTLSFTGEYKRDIMQYYPAEPTYDYRANIWGVRSTYIF